MSKKVAVIMGSDSDFPVVKSALTELKKRGCSLMILSNCRHSYMEAHRTALGLDKWVDDYFCGEDYGFIPKEDIFTLIMQKYPSRSFVMVGDRASDIAAGDPGYAAELRAELRPRPAIPVLHGFGMNPGLVEAIAALHAPARAHIAVEFDFEGEEPDASPVQRADHGERKRDPVDHIHHES